MMEYSWKNDKLWQIRINENDFDDFKQPYIGNGILGCRFDKLVIGVDEKPLCNLSRAVYDGGRQLFLPAWNHIGLLIDGAKYAPENGNHNLEQVLDLRNGVVYMTDNWEYKSGKTIGIEVEMFVPRTFEHSSYMSFSIKNLKVAANIKFGILGKGLSEYFKMKFYEINATTIIGDYTTKKQNRPVSQALSWKYSGLTSLKTIVEQDEISISADTSGEEVKLELFHTLSSYEEDCDTKNNALKSVKHILDSGRDRLMEVSALEWEKLWKNALAFRNDDFEKEKTLIAHQFYLLCSLEACDYPLGPLGLSKNEWCGSQLWDGDLWLFRGILPLWPDYAKSFIRFREKTIESAKIHAYGAGYKGAWYGWLTDDKGMNMTPIRWNDELHLNVWIAMAAWEYYIFTQDEQYLRDTGWPIISEIADFFASRAELERDGFYHINIVVGPNESVCESEYGHLRVNDNFTTNYGVKKLMKTACEGAKVVGVEVKEMWEKLKDRIYLLQPNADGIIPEYKNYNDAKIKQADLILAFYPLGYETDKDIILKNLNFYRDKVDYHGPLMSIQIDCCIMMKMGEKEKGLKVLLDEMKEFSRGKHYIPFECRGVGDNSIMLTGIGGELQALIFGYYEADINNTGNIPRMSEYMD
jgi:trehalose/maltose hydrolase-like predicted phosphorylase